MSENNMQDNSPYDQRKVVINGKRYHTMTAHKCSTCSSAQYLYLKQKHTGGCVTLECPNCDSQMSLREEMINYNLNG
jgi:hypothetical protein